MANPYISLLKTAWTYARQERKRFVLVYGMFSFSNLVDAAHPLVFGWFINRIQRDPSHVIDSAVLYAGAYVLLKLLEWSFHGPARIMERELAFNLSRNFLQERYHQALHLPVKWHQDHHSGSTINRIRKAYEALKGFFDGGFMYLHALYKFVLSFAAMLIFSPLFGSIGILLGLITIWVIFKFDKPFIKTQEEINEKEHLISATLFDSLSNIMTVITLRLEKSMEKGILARVKDLLKPFKRNVLINEWKWFTADILIAVIYAVIVVGFVYQHWEPGKTFYIGTLVTLLGYVNQFTSVFHDVAWQYTQIIQYNTDVQTAVNIEEAFAKHHRADLQEELPENWQTVILSGLNFSHQEEYQGNEKAQSLHKIGIRLQKGKRIAMIGESGSGKTTLLALLRGLYEPEPGYTMMVDGKSYSLGSLNQTVTLFPQEPEIFENTILYNLTLGLPFSAEDIQEVCDCAHFIEVIDQLPRKLDSNIQEKGVNLSGGQKQRLALARGILAARESDVVLLDEPTSSVDPKTEAQIYENLFSVFADKAMVTSLHRLHLLPLFDYIYVLGNGVIIAEGKFEDLRLQSKAFQSLWKHQEEIRKNMQTQNQ
jgi:ABC-type multidrug transport system fused ATPase/permease subunit